MLNRGASAAFQARIGAFFSGIEPVDRSPAHHKAAAQTLGVGRPKNAGSEGRGSCAGIFA